MSLVDVGDTELRERILATPKDILGARIKDAREAAGLSHDRVDGISRQSLIDIEKGRARPRARTLRLIAEQTKRDVDSFLGAEVTNGKRPFRGRKRG